MRICYIHRDLRDVAVSLREMQGAEDDRIVGVLDDAVLAYNELRPVRDSPYVLWQRYEDVVADVRGATEEIARFLKLEVPSNIIDEIADGTVARAPIQRIHPVASEHRSRFGPR